MFYFNGKSNVIYLSRVGMCCPRGKRYIVMDTKRQKSSRRKQMKKKKRRRRWCLPDDCAIVDKTVVLGSLLVVVAVVDVPIDYSFFIISLFSRFFLFLFLFEFSSNTNSMFFLIFFFTRSTVNKFQFVFFLSFLSSYSLTAYTVSVLHFFLSNHHNKFQLITENIVDLRFEIINLFWLNCASSIQ